MISTSSYNYTRVIAKYNIIICLMVIECQVFIRRSSIVVGGRATVTVDDAVP